jgi:hypothetical protein
MKRVSEIPDAGTVVLSLEGECPFCGASFEVDVRVGSLIRKADSTRVGLNIADPYGLHSCEVEA